jgi:hypothetical protein
MSNLHILVEQIREYSLNKKYIFENLESLTEEQFEDILVEVAEEQQLTVEQAEELIQELFGIGYKVKTAATKVATPFKAAAGFVKGVKQRVGNAVGGVINKVKTARANADERAKKQYTKAKTAQTRTVNKAFGAGSGEKPKPTTTRPGAGKPKPTI